MKILTENDYKVLSRIFDIKENKGISKINGITRNELVKKTNLSYTKIRIAINSLIEYGFVEIGIAKGREKTFYITEEGLLELKNITMPSINLEGGKVNE